MARTEHLERTLEALRRREDEFTAEFYRRLFELRPDFMPLFAEVSIAEQAANLMASLVLIVESHRQADRLEHYFQKLGHSHRSMGLTNKHYKVWRTVMLDTLADFCGSEWDDDARCAWRDTFIEATKVMLATSEEKAPTP